MSFRNARAEGRAGGWIALSVAALTIGALLLLSGCPNPFLKGVGAAIPPPTMSPGGGVFGTDQYVSLHPSLSGATIYYTTDGSTPTPSSTIYSGPIPVAGNGTSEVVKAIESAGGKSSAVVEASFTINYSVGGVSTLAAPTFSVSSGVYPTAPAVTLSYPAGASVYYTTNGTTPSASNGTLYNAANGVVGIATSNGASTTVRAVTVESGYISSTVVSASYVIDYAQVGTPQFSPAPGVYSTDQTGITITIPSAPSGTSVYYTFTPGSTTGTAPATSAGGSTSEYSSNGSVVTPVPAVSGNGTVVTIEAVATAPGYADSTVAKGTYTIEYTATTAAPAIGISSPSGSVSGADVSWTTSLPTVTVTGDSSNTTYYYTIAYSTSGTAVSVPGSATATGLSATLASSTSPAWPSGAPGASTPTPVTVTVVAVDPDEKPSTPVSATYYLNEPASTPLFSLGSARYASDQTLVVTDASPGSTIYATVANGSTGATPSPSSYTYSGASPLSIPLKGPLAAYTVEAMATAPGMSGSAVTSPATYTIAYLTVVLSSPGDTPFTVPSTISSLAVSVKMWGGGGGGGYGNGAPGGNGGGGGYAEGSLTLASGTSFTVQVGKGGAGGTVGGALGGTGGQKSYLTSGSTFYAVAGGGGGGGEGFSGGGTGGSGGGAGQAGGNDTLGGNGGAAGSAGSGGAGGVGLGSNGSSGTSLSSGFDGGAGGLYGSSSYGGSGGDGNGGGGGGGTATTGDGGGGGGGGNLGNIAVDGSGTLPGNSSDSDYVAGVGIGGALGNTVTGSGNGSAGGNGLVVLDLN